MVSRSSLKKDFESHMSKSVVDTDGLSSSHSLYDGSKKKKEFHMSKSMNQYD
jgi:hypothetical protein